jgi:long-chain acyl-CoA synthetase
VRLDDLLFGTPPDADSDAPLVHVADESFSRADVRARAVALAATLRDMGLAVGSPVGVMLPDGVELVSALFGVWRSGAVYIPLNPRFTDAEIAHILEVIEPEVIVTTADQAGRFADRAVVCVTTPAPFWQAERLPLDAVRLPEHERREGEEPRVRYDADVGLIQFTSGTTGRPKPVLLLHSGVLTLLDGVLEKLRGGRLSAATPDNPPMPNLVPVSLSLWAGIYNVLFAMRVGAAVVIMRGFDTGQFVELVRRFEIRSTVLPPAAMTMLADDPTITDLSPLRFVRSITAPLSPFQARRFRDQFGIAVLNSYGQTEIGGEIVGWSAADSRQFGDTKLGSVGRPHRGVELRVVDNEGEPVDPGDAGELLVRTPALSAGYADGSGSDGAPFADRLTGDGWFRTGDVARVDDDGFLWIEGRASDMINRGGLKVFPADVEEVIRLDPSVADVAVVGVADVRVGEVPWAFVVAADPARPPRAEALDAWCRRHLVPYKVPARFVGVDSLPRNEVGKVLVRELVSRAGATP